MPEQIQELIEKLQQLSRAARFVSARYSDGSEETKAALAMGRSVAYVRAAELLADLLRENS